MNDTPTHIAPPSDPARFAHNMVKVFEGAGRLAALFANQSTSVEKEMERQALPLEQVQKTLGEVARAYAGNPQKLMEAQARLWADYGQIWQDAWRRALGESTEALAAPEKGDKRFKDPDWQANPFFDFVKQAYLVSTRWAQDMVKNAEGLDPHTRQKAKFYVEQIANALSPTNFVFTNPEVLRATLQTNGENLAEGLRNLEQDLAAGGGRLQIKQTNVNAFEVGRNLAVTPGKVVFRNETFELIQYAPSTEEVREIPLLIVPPWINKFYILDLTPQKSFVRWAVAQGLTVFVVSWINPDEAHGHRTFGDYVKDGFLAALDAVQKATGAAKVNAIGYCVGGTMLASALGYMAAKGDERVNAATFFTTQVDFEKAGDLLVYVDDEQVRWIEDRMAEKGYLPGRRMADAFNLLRSNDLIWSYIVNNYMLGKEPAPFDLLYWNSDTTRMPAGVHSYYLRECYLHNRLAKGQLALDNHRIDLSRVKIPIYNLAARDDHIAPLPSVFQLSKHFGGETRLVVAGSGHIAGVVNPPEAKKYQYWTNDQGAQTLEDWFKGATEHPGSWWPDWAQWIGARSGGKVKARQPCEGGLPALGDAPGSYVRVRAD
jgi:polyhydroxyalkanoate synthase